MKTLAFLVLFLSGLNLSAQEIMTIGNVFDLSMVQKNLNLLKALEQILAYSTKALILIILVNVIIYYVSIRMEN